MMAPFLAIGGFGTSTPAECILKSRCLLFRVLAYGEDLFAAVANPRLHHQLLPGILFAENWETAPGGVTFGYSNKTLQVGDLYLVPSNANGG